MILITGGAGYIGSNCALELIKNNENIIIFDNLSTGHIETIETLKKINPNLIFIKGDLKNPKEIEDVFKIHKIECVLHFASLSVVQESAKIPEDYYQNNVIGSTNLLNAMVKYNVLKIIFSSSAAIFGQPKYLPIDENHPKNPINPYGKNKLEIENILDDFDKKYNLKSIKLRYFNVIGANRENLLGEWHDKETHLVPNIIKSAINQKPFEIYGNDYNTKDGTCIRDYIDINDLIEAHKLAYLYLNKENKSDEFNLGIKQGISVKEIFKTVEKILNQKIDYKISQKRQNEPSILISDSSKANKLLNWKAKTPLSDSIKSAYRWELKLQKKSI